MWRVDISYESQLKTKSLKKKLTRLIRKNETKKPPRTQIMAIYLILILIHVASKLNGASLVSRLHVP